MTKPYKIISFIYRVILGLSIPFFLIVDSILTEVHQNENNLGLWAALFSIITLIVVTTFHELRNNNKYKIFVQFFVCIFVLMSLVFLVFSISQVNEGLYLITFSLLMLTFVNAVLLFYLIQDRKYNHND
ncbi:hypothetical protein [Flavobacterium sp.]|uniref:hypothetical protein n=1 Tax=Flavobacterium sp. TaxID=239 RepID=UPI00375116C2